MLGPNPTKLPRVSLVTKADKHRRQTSNKPLTILAETFRFETLLQIRTGNDIAHATNPTAMCQSRSSETCRGSQAKWWRKRPLALLLFACFSCSCCPLSSAEPNFPRDFMSLPKPCVFRAWRVAATLLPFFAIHLKV